MSPGGDPGAAADRVKQAQLTPLGGQDVQTILRALPPIQKQDGDRKDFALRERSLPPPRTARTIDQAFPPKETRALPKVEAQALEVVNVAPRGNVEMAPHLTVTFNQPMVALTTVEQLAEKEVPVKLTPAVEGNWRWLGTQTLMFVPKVRLPMATEFTVEVPAGITSASGQKLAKPRLEKFTTPPPVLQQSSPSGGGLALHPIIFLRFDQDVDAKAVAAGLRFNGPPLRLATKEEIVEDDAVSSWTKDQPEKRWLALMPSEDLKPGTSYSVVVPAGTHSLEGPLPTGSDQSFSFSTYDPLHLVWKTDNSEPGQSWSVQFNNELNSDKFDPKWVRVSPDIPNLRVKAQGSGLTLRGQAKGQQDYQVTVAPELLDRFGQRLGKAERFTVKVGKASPRFQGPGQDMLVLDPSGRPELPFTVVNYDKLRVRLWKVTPADWQKFQTYRSAYYSNLKEQIPPGTQVLDKVIETRAGVDQETEVQIDLSTALEGGLGHVVAQVEVEPPPKERWERNPYIGWVQSTHIGLDAMNSPGQLVGWASDLATGKPLEGVEFNVGAAEGVSDADGLVKMPTVGGGTLLVGRKGQDVAFMQGYWNGSSPGDSPLWHVLDDRKLYRPGETVHIKGWVRHHQYGPKGDLVATRNTSVNYRLVDPVGNEIGKGQARVGKLGGFDFQFGLPKTVNLGNCRLELSGDIEGNAYHNVEVQEFRRPEFEVSADANPGSTQIGSSTTLNANASYYSGGPLANADVQWTVSSTPTSYSPPGWEAYTFGTWTPWWDYRCWWEPPAQGGGNASNQADHTDSKGKAHLKVDFLSVNPPQPHSVSAQATVQDVNRQTWTASTSVLVHPAGLYVGLKSERVFVEAGQPLELSVVVTDLDGKAVAGRPVLLRAYRLEWEDGEVKHADEKEQTVTSAAEAVKASIPAGAGGTYQVEAFIQDDQNRSNHSQLTLWVAGGKQLPDPHVQQEQITLVPGKKEYQPGETAEILVQAPFAPAELVVTTRRNGIASLQHVSAPKGTATLKIPVEDLHIPGLTVQVDALGHKPRTDANGQVLAGEPNRPAYASGAVTLAVSRASRKLGVTVKPEQAQLAPGGQTRIRVDLKDYQGNPVQGEVTLILVDESVLALTGYSHADPLDTFCQGRSSDVSDFHSRALLLLQHDLAAGDTDAEEGLMSLDRAGGGGGVRYRRAMPSATAAPAPEAPSKQAMAMEKVAAQSEAKDQLPTYNKGGEDDGAVATTPVQFTVRSNFDPLAHFEPTLVTDARGHGEIKVKLPDNLTRYRLVALAAADARRFGKGESSLVARQPLQLRPAAPRFLNFGDHCQLPVVVQNQTDLPMQVALVCRASNARLDKGAEAAGYSLQVPAQDRVEVQFPCDTQMAGTARFQFAATTQGGSDAAEISLPVWTPSTTEAFASYGVIDEGAVQQAVEKPKNVWPQFGALSITTTSTALSELTDAFIYLAQYPYGCTEQVSSRMLAAAALRDVLSAFQAPGMADPAQMKTAMAADLDKLRGLQCDDGGWDYWVRNKPSIAYLTVHITHALVRCKDKGFTVDEGMLERALAYLDQIESHIPVQEYGWDCQRSIRAYALYVLNLAGRPNLEKARALFAEAGTKNLEVLGWLLPTLAKDPASKGTVDEIYRYLDNHSTQTASTAQFNVGYGDNGYLILYSDRRDDGILLESMIATRPKHPLIPKLVRGLLDHRSAGRWENTQENCWVLLALDRYFHQYENVTPDFVARVWLGSAYAGEQKFHGREKDEKRIQIPIDRLNNETLTLAKSGAGRLYYRLGLNYCPKDLKQGPADYGFSVQRSYEAVRDNRDVRRDGDGVWHIKAGAEVRVNLTMQAPSRRYHVALVDPLPAGLEAVNPALLGGRPVSAAAPSNRYDGWWSRYWYEHENLRDERVEAFTQLLWEGVYTYSYVARATTPGKFVVPPTKAEEMYHPETFGRSGSDQVIVEE